MVRIIFSLMLLLCANGLSAQTERENALLWRITVPHQQVPAYLFGTIHSEDARVLALPPAVVQTLDECRYFVMELVPDAVSEQLNRSMLLPQGQRLSTLLDRPLYRKVQQALAQYGMPAEAAEEMKPWALVMILNMPKPVTGLYLDRKLHAIATARGKEVRGIETLEEQIEALDGMSMAMQIELLRHTLDHYQEIPAFTGQLIDAWLRRDLAALRQLGEESNEGLSGETVRQLHARLIDSRNARMAERVAPLLRQGGAFVAVGALHLPGEQGLIALLRQRGFTVEAVY